VVFLARRDVYPEVLTLAKHTSLRGGRPERAKSGLLDVLSGIGWVLGLLKARTVG
jgi:hypothetical protein